MLKKDNPVTYICTSTEDAIFIRDKNLVEDLVGKMTFTEMLLFHLLKQPPTEMQTVIVDAVLITIMEHGLTPSAIAARETYLGAPESLQGAVAAGLLGVGAPKSEKSGVATAIVQRHRKTKTPVPGFGHPIHKKGDPRTPRLVEIAETVGARGDYIAAMHLLSEAMDEEFGKHIVINVSAAIGAVLCEAGIPVTITRGITLVSRCAGLVGHLLEEMEEPSATYLWHLAEEKIPYAGEAGK